MKPQKDIRSLSREELSAQIKAMGEPSFRAGQIYDWLWKKNVSDWDEMRNVSKKTREALNAHFSLQKVRISASQQSKDGTLKYAFRLAGGQEVEGVLIPTAKRLTACISSQVGCSLDCKFCATGTLALKHNLHHFEIYDQVALLQAEAQRYFDRNLTNIVYMGMGEPLLNYRNVLASIQMITSPEGMGMSPQRITVSTAGIAKMIKKLGDDQVKFEFALSLHATNDAKRSQIMSINESNSLEALKEALQYFYQKTGTRVTYEYCIFRNFNDGLTDAEELAAFSKVIPSKINIIEYNPVAESPFQNTSRQRMDAFIQYLESQKCIVNVRRSRGRDIDGACGQLALRGRK